MGTHGKILQTIFGELLCALFKGQPKKVALLFLGLEGGEARINNTSFFLFGILVLRIGSKMQSVRLPPFLFSFSSSLRWMMISPGEERTFASSFLHLFFPPFSCMRHPWKTVSWNLYIFNFTFFAKTMYRLLVASCKFLRPCGLLKLYESFPQTLSMSYVHVSEGSNEAWDGDDACPLYCVSPFSLHSVVTGLPPKKVTIHSSSVTHKWTRLGENSSSVHFLEKDPLSPPSSHRSLRPLLLLLFLPRRRYFSSLL